MTWEIHPTNLGTGLPLEGVRVLDFSRVLAAPLCAMVVGDLGADVIKVEGPGGDPVRSLAPPRFGDDATYYLAVNRHRRNVVADLRDPRDFARVAALVVRADAVIENFLPAQARELGVERLRALNPECVWVSVTPASGDGPLSSQPSFDLLAQARSGLMDLSGEPAGPPSKVGAPVADVIAGLYATVGLLCGLVAVARERPGRHYEAPLLESTMTALVNQAQGYLSTGVSPVRLGNEHPSIAPYGPVECADGLIMLAVGTDAQFESLVARLDDEDLRDHREFATNAERVRYRDSLRLALNRVFKSRSVQEWLATLSDSNVPHAPILNVAQAFAQPQIRDGDFVSTMTAPAGETRVMASPLRIDGRRPAVRRGPRLYAQDNDEVFGDVE